MASVFSKFGVGGDGWELCSPKLARPFQSIAIAHNVKIKTAALQALFAPQLKANPKRRLALSVLPRRDSAAT